MKKLKDLAMKNYLFVCLLLVILPGKVNADDEGFYLGFGVSQNSYEYAGQSYDGGGGNWTLGYKFNQDMSFQFEIGLGSADSEDESVIGDYMGFYGTYRSQGDLYFVGKAGLNTVYLSSAESTSTSFSGGGSTVSIESDSEDKFGIGLGAGAGVKFTPSFRLEAGLTLQASSMQTIGLNLLYIF